MFKAKQELYDLQRKYDQLQKECKEYQTEIKKLCERLRNKENGEPCEGLHCQDCVHAIDVASRVYVSNFGVRETANVVCALTAPCKRFKRKGG